MDTRKLLPLLGTVLFPLLAHAATFGPETPVAPPEYATAYGGQDAASVACNGESCVAIWSEFDPLRPGLYSSVIEADGSVHPVPSNLLRSGSQTSVGLVSVGDHYLAVWDDYDAHAHLAAPLSRDGLLAGEVQNLGPLWELIRPGSLAWNGRHAFVAFSGQNGFETAILDADGHLIHLHTLAFSWLPTSFYAVAAAGETFAIVWAGAAPVPADGVNLYMERFDDSGAPVDPFPITLVANRVSFEPIVMTSNGSELGVAFVTSDTGGMQRLRVDARTAVVESLPLTSFPSSIRGIYWSGDDFVVYAWDVDNIDTARFSFDTVSVLNVSPTFIEEPQIAQGPSGAVAIWTDSASSPYSHITAAMLDRDSTSITRPRLTISWSAVPQTRPVLAPSPAGALLGWQNEGDDGQRVDIVATRLDPSGKPIDATPIAIVSGVEGVTGRSALWLGKFYLVVWSAGGSIVGKRISASGVVLDQDPIVYGKGVNAALASNGTTTILVMDDPNLFGIGLVRLDSNAAAIDSHPVAVANRVGGALSAATNGNEFVIAWTDGFTGLHVIPHRDILAVRAGATGLPIDAAPIVIANTPADEIEPAVASDGRDFLIAYTDQTNLLMKVLLREGAVIDAGSISGNMTFNPQVVFDGIHYVLTWSDQLSFRVARTATVDNSGALADPPAVLVQGDSGYFVQTAIAPGMVAYSRGNAADDGIPRIFTRQILSPQIRGRAVRH